jgi:hypothetical protein
MLHNAHLCIRHDRNLLLFGVEALSASDEAHKVAHGYSGVPNGSDRRHSLGRLAPVVEEPVRSALTEGNVPPRDIFGSWDTAATTLPGTGKPMQSSAEWLHRQVRYGCPPIISQFTCLVHCHIMAATGVSVPSWCIRCSHCKMLLS